MIEKCGKYYNIKHYGQEGCLYGLTEEDLYTLFWDVTKVLAPIRGETDYPSGAFDENA
jgi:hypothetical protein